MTNKLFAVVSLVLAGVLMGSCGGKEPVKEEDTLSIDPPEVNATKEMTSYKIGITSNASWTASFTDESGADAVWGVLDRGAGKGDATITLRVYENKYKSARTGLLTVSTKGGKKASVKVTQEGDSGSEQEHTTLNLRMGTYNMRGSWLSESDAVNDWETRKSRMQQSFQDCAFDVVGLQEVGSAQQSWLTSTFGGSYTFRFFSPYSQNGNGDRGQGIAWRTDAFTMSGWLFFWLGSEPGVMSTNDTGTQGSFKRGGCCCILTHKTSGAKIFVMNTHGCMNADKREIYAPQYEQMEKQYNVDGLPSFFVGDMNSSESTEAGAPYVVYTSYWKDSYKEAPSNKRYGSALTFNGYSSVTGKSRIDMVFFRGGNPITINTYTCKNTLYGGLYASDHFPVYVDATINY